MRSAYQWGKDHGSCQKALDWRETLGNAGQRKAYQVCQRGDWMFWTFQHLTEAQFELIRERMHEALLLSVNRQVAANCLICGVPAVEKWAKKWLSGEDRSAESAAWDAARSAASAAWSAARFAAWSAARFAARSAAWSAAWSAARFAARSAEFAAWSAAWSAESAGWCARFAELRQQARDLRRLIPAWPGNP